MVKNRQGSGDEQTIPDSKNQITNETKNQTVVQGIRLGLVAVRIGMILYIVNLFMTVFFYVCECVCFVSMF